MLVAHLVSRLFVVNNVFLNPKQTLEVFFLSSLWLCGRPVKSGLKQAFLVLFQLHQSSLPSWSLDWKGLGEAGEEDRMR